MSSRLLRASLFSAVVSLTSLTVVSGSSTAWAGQPPTVREPARAPVAQVASRPAPSGAEPSRDAAYAARQAKAPQAAKFKGGESVGIYIGGSTVAVILAIVLLVILL